MLRSLKLLWYSFRKCRVPEKGNENVIVRLVAASRLCVIPMTFYAVTIGGLISWISGEFDPVIYLALLVGFIGAHLLDNLINDYYDYKRGFDDPKYFRALYGPHPLLDNIISIKSIELFIILVFIYDLLLTVYLSITVTPLITVLAAVGVLVMLLYAGIPVDAKRLGAGEILVAIVWGPVMVGGTILALTGEHTALQALVYAPFAISVTLVLIGKHLDKYKQDSKKGIATLPVRLGLHAARGLASLLAIILPLMAIFTLAVYEKSLPALIPLASTPVAIYAYRILSREKPREAPPGWDVWPLWYVAGAYMVMDTVGRTTLASLLVYGLDIHGFTMASWIIFIVSIIFEVYVGLKLFASQKQ